MRILLGILSNWSLRRCSFLKNWVAFKAFGITMRRLCYLRFRMQWRMVRRLLLLCWIRPNDNWRYLSIQSYYRFMLCSLHWTCHSPILPKCPQILKRLVKSSYCIATCISNYRCFWISILTLFLGYHYWSKLWSISWPCSPCCWIWSWRWSRILSC